MRSRTSERARGVGTQHDNAECSLHVAQGLPHTAEQVAVAAVKEPDELRQRFGVGFAGEFRALFFQHLPQLAEVLDDAVMNHGDVVGRMLVRVALGRLAMGGPAGVADAGI